MRPLFKVDYACLPTIDQVIDSGTRCWVAGWGKRSNHVRPGDLREVDLTIFSDEECKSKLDTSQTEKKSKLGWYNDEVFDMMMCAGSQVGIFTKSNSFIQSKVRKTIPLKSISKGRRTYKKHLFGRFGWPADVRH